MGFLRIVIAGLVGCWLGPSAPHAKPIHIVATFNILGDIVQQIVGDIKDITVDSIVKANQDPHTYEPTPQDAKILARADLIFALGLTFEDGWIQKLIKASGFQGKEIIVSQNIKQPRKIQTGGRVIMDPHVWHDVSLARTFIPVIRDAISALDPLHKEDYHRNAAGYDEALQQLHQEVAKLFHEIPLEKRKIVTTHDAFHYLKNYGIVVYAPLGISTDAEASAKEMIALIERVKAEDIRAIFLENMSNEKLVKQIAKEAFGEIKIDRVLYADTLSPPDGPAPTYITLIRHNTKMILEALKR